MNRWVGVAALAAILAATPAAAVQIGIGVTGGASVPLGQSDNAAGGEYGLHLPINVMPLLTVEPFLTSTGLGSVDATFGGQTYVRDGFDIVSYGAVVALGGMGLGPRYPLFPFLSVGGYHLGREGGADEVRVGYSAGVGYARQLSTHFSANLRSDYHWIDVGGADRRFFEIGAGVTLRFFPVTQEKL